MKKFTLFDLAALIIWLSTFVYLWFTYSTLPTTVPLHFNLKGIPDRYGNKSEFVWVQIMLNGIAMLVYLLLKFLPAIDPKKKVVYGEATFSKLALGILVFFSALSITIMYATSHSGIEIERIILPIMGLLMAFIGNVMHSLKPNYFAGVRTPWTLEDEDTWRATHRLASKLWFLGGLFLTVLILLVPGTAGYIVFMSGIAVLVLVPVVYSYVYFKKHQLK